MALPLRRAWAAGILGVEALHPHHELITPAAMARWQRRHLAIAAWTVDHPAELRRLARLGVHAVCCNDPRAAQAALSAT
jgi:glycerophosphoryl diester phosphodiesterase